MGNPTKLCVGTSVAVILWFILLISVNGYVDSNENRGFEWQIINRYNFSSQIRLHQHVLLMVTVPWSGESRSLMKEIVQMANHKKENLSHLNLMIIYRNADKKLADLLGATKEITLFCYRHSVAYRYRGRLRAQNILSSVHYLMLIQPKELPFKQLNTPLDLQMFLQSTDKAVLLLELCGWTPKLLAKQNEEIFDKVLTGEEDGTIPYGGKENLKGSTGEKLTCEIEKRWGEIPWLTEFIGENRSSSLGYVNEKAITTASCTVEGFPHYETFFEKFTTLAREYFLPPERQRFGLISRRSLLPSLGVGNLDGWSLMLQFLGCPNCSKIFKEGDDLKDALLMRSTFVTELEGEGHDLEPALPINQPSIILFVDRLSESSKVRKKSKEALEVFRKVACQTMKGKDGINTEGISTSGPSRYSRHRVSETPGVVKSKDKMAFVITNEGGTVTLDETSADTHVTSAHDILAYLLQRKNPGLETKERKLSFLAKEVGFQLLSDDFQVKISEIVSSEKAAGQPNEVSSSVLTSPEPQNLETLIESVIGNSVGGGNLNNPLKTISISGTENKEEPRVETATSNDEKSQINSVGLAQEPTNVELKIMERVIVFEGDHTSKERVGSFKQERQHHAFGGSFFFLDAGYRFLSILASDKNIPSVMILDPISQQHYIFPRDMVLNYSSLINFVGDYVNGSLSPYQRSESVLRNPRETPRPPFVNLDFHEADSVPRVTTNAFSDLVLGFNHCDRSHEKSCMDTQNVGHAWKKDVLVLFSNSWCGFCQRMELVVREVHRAFKGYMSMLQSQTKDREAMLSQDIQEGVMLDELPSIFRIDCTLNDCTSLLKSMGQKEFYPALILFPSEKKNPISYEGDISVTNIIHFLATHGSISGHLHGKEGILWNKAWKRGKNADQSHDPSSSFSLDITHAVKSGKHDFLLNHTQVMVDEGQFVDSRISDKLENESQNIVVGSFLIATDKLLNAPPFDNSTILMVKVDKEEGFQGLIINKPIEWAILPDLDKELELLKSAPLSYGGPLVVPSMPFVSLARHATELGYLEVAPGFYFGNQLATSHTIDKISLGNLSVTDFWFFFGYSSWGWDQLFDELRGGVWLTQNYQIGHLDWPEFE